MLEFKICIGNRILHTNMQTGRAASLLYGLEVSGLGYLPSPSTLARVTGIKMNENLGLQF